LGHGSRLSGTDISLIAFDEIDFAPFLICALTTVSQPKDVMGEIAVKLLVEQMKNPNIAPDRKPKCGH
jgi:LacI family transcriptional regulator